MEFSAFTLYVERGFTHRKCPHIPPPGTGLSLTRGCWCWAADKVPQRISFGLLYSVPTWTASKPGPGSAALQQGEMHYCSQRAGGAGMVGEGEISAWRAWRRRPSALGLCKTGGPGAALHLMNDPPNLSAVPHGTNHHSAIPSSSSIHFNINQTTKQNKKNNTQQLHHSNTCAISKETLHLLRKIECIYPSANKHTSGAQRCAALQQRCVQRYTEEHREVCPFVFSLKAQR